MCLNIDEIVLSYTFTACG